MRWFPYFLGCKITTQKCKKIYSIEKALILNFIEWRMSSCSMLCQCIYTLMHICGCCWRKQCNSSKYCERFQMKFYWNVMLHSFMHLPLEESWIVISMQKHSSLHVKYKHTYSIRTQTKRQKKRRSNWMVLFHVHFMLYCIWLAVAMLHDGILQYTSYQIMTNNAHFLLYTWQIIGCTKYLFRWLQRI